MKRATLISTLVGAILIGGFATAHGFSSSAPSDFAAVTLYDEDPAAFGNVLAVAEMGDGPIAKRLIDTDDEDEDVTKYVTVELDGQLYTFETFPGGSSKNSIYLDINEVDLEDALTLGELLEEVAADPDTLTQLERTSTDVSVQAAQRN